MKTMSWSLAVGLGFLLAGHITWGQGSLAPPGPPAPSMKTLDQVEARTPISAAGYQIQAPGSYYLTTNLVTTGSTPAIRVLVANVTIDLNGFSILGESGTGNGVTLDRAASDAVIMNGAIRDCFGHGIFGANTIGCIYRNLRVLENGRGSAVYAGIWAGQSAQVEGCRIAANDDGCTVSDCTASGNGSWGIYVGQNSSVMGSVAAGNGSHGVSIFYWTRVADCVMTDNEGDGVII